MIWEPAAPERSELEKNREYRDMRNEQFLMHGIDRDGMTSFVVDKAEPLPGRVLDIGTGRGFTAVELARRGAGVTTIDMSEETLKSAYLHSIDSGVAERIEFHLADGGDLPFDEGSFEVVIMINVLHHLENPAAVLPEIARVLMPGGRLIVSDFTDKGFDILEEIHRKEGRRHDRHAGETIDGLAARLDDVGMKCVCRDRRFHQLVMVAEKN
ncbi:MAG: class I SAM-dependent methyltransferase [Candidatus Krumholzibacteria bacterium]|nr:class I SAM-dependent methyltransferase [Candidatus Krumholzibacteria bacterium]